MFRRPRTARWTLAAAVTVLAPLAVASAASPAWALPGLTIAQDLGPLNSATKSLSVPCPRGLVVVGGGAKVTGPGQSYVHLGTLQPQEATHSFGVVAWEVEPGTNLGWQINAFAVCVQPLPGLVYRYDDTALDQSSEAGQTLDVWCPTGTTVIGLGAYVNGGGQVLLQGLYPVASNGVRAWAHEDWSGYAYNWTLGVWAVCADVEAISSSRTTAMDATNPKAPITPCWPSPVHPYVHSVGFNLAGGAGRVLVTDVIPAFDHKQAVVGFEEDPLGTAQDWMATTYAVCAP
jgi:hypothetical protein